MVTFDDERGRGAVLPHRIYQSGEVLEDFWSTWTRFGGLVQPTLGARLWQWAIQQVVEIRRMLTWRVGSAKVRRRRRRRKTRLALKDANGGAVISSSSRIKLSQWLWIFLSEFLRREATCSPIPQTFHGEQWESTRFVDASLLMCVLLLLDA